MQTAGDRSTILRQEDTSWRSRTPRAIQTVFYVRGGKGRGMGLSLATSETKNQLEIEGTGAVAVDCCL